MKSALQRILELTFAQTCRATALDDIARDMPRTGARIMATKKNWAILKNMQYIFNIGNFFGQESYDKEAAGHAI